MMPLDWQVVQNGLDFLENAVADMATGDEARAKYVALHLFASIEVLIKARLSREHWSLTVADIGKATRAAYEAGDVRSVGAGQGLARLRDVVGVAVSAEQIQRVKDLERLRNRAAHFALGGEPPEAVTATFGRGLDFLLWFIGTQLRPAAPENHATSIDELVDAISAELGKIKTLVQVRMKTISADLGNAELVVACPMCRQPAMVLETDERAKCLFCLWSPEPEVSATDHVGVVLGITQYEVVKDGGQWPVESCLQCAADALVHGVLDHQQPEIVWGCFACGFTGREADIERCSRCGAITDTGVDGMVVCADCATYILSSD